MNIIGLDKKEIAAVSGGFTGLEFGLGAATFLLVLSHTRYGNSIRNAGGRVFVAGAGALGSALSWMGKRMSGDSAASVPPAADALEGLAAVTPETLVPTSTVVEVAAKARGRWWLLGY